MLFTLVEIDDDNNNKIFWWWTKYTHDLILYIQYTHILIANLIYRIFRPNHTCVQWKAVMRDCINFWFNSTNIRTHEKYITDNTIYPYSSSSLWLCSPKDYLHPFQSTYLISLCIASTKYICYMRVLIININCMEIIECLFVGFRDFDKVFVEIEFNRILISFSLRNKFILFH